MAQTLRGRFQLALYYLEITGTWQRPPSAHVALGKFVWVDQGVDVRWQNPCGQHILVLITEIALFPGAMNLMAIAQLYRVGGLYRAGVSPGCGSGRTKCVSYVVLYVLSSPWGSGW